MPKQRLDSRLRLDISKNSRISSSVDETIDSSLFPDTVKGCNIKYTSSVAFIKDLLPMSDSDLRIPYFFYTYSNEIRTSDYKRLFGFERHRYRPIFERIVKELLEKRNRTVLLQTKLKSSLRSLTDYIRAAETQSRLLLFVYKKLDSSMAIELRLLSCISKQNLDNFKSSFSENDRSFDHIPNVLLTIYIDCGELKSVSKGYETDTTSTDVAFTRLYLKTPIGSFDTLEEDKENLPSNQIQKYSVSECLNILRSGN